MPRGRGNAAALFCCRDGKFQRRKAAKCRLLNVFQQIEISLRTVGWSRTTGKPGFNPSNLVPHGVANDSACIEVGISFPLNPIALLADAGKRLSPDRWGNCGIGISRNYENWTVRSGRAKLIAVKIPVHEWIALPGWIHDLCSGQFLRRPCRRARLLQLLVECQR